MQVFEIAKEVGVESAEVKTLLGKKTHLDKLDDAEVSAVRIAFASSTKAEIKSEEKSSILRFWSEIKDHRIQCPEGMIEFNEFVLIAREESTAGRWLLATDSRVTKDDPARMWPEIRVVVNKPFSDTESRSAFGQILRERVFTGGKDEPAIVRGLGFLYALFEESEQKMLSGMSSLDATIQKAVETKSYINCSDWSERQ